MALPLNRRTLLRHAPPTLATLYALAGAWPRHAVAGPPAVAAPYLVKVHLDGAPDMRHIFAPKPASDPTSPGYQFWRARSAVYGVGQDPAAWSTAFGTLYAPASFNGVDFGILKEAGWLRRAWDQGQVAIINNVLASDSRDHVFGSVVVQTGYTDLAATDRNRGGFGGRLVKALNASVAGFHGASQFCYAPHPSDPTGHTLDRVISIEDARRMGFHQSNGRRANRADTAGDAVVERSLESFYRGKDARALHPAHRNFPAFEKLYRALGQRMTERLAGLATPDALSRLAVRDGNVRNEFRACYESLLCADILNLRAGYIFYGGWDTHDTQLGRMKDLVTDLFGTGKALDALCSSLAAQHPSASDRMILLLAGEFGRKLRANGSRGTDHGIGNSVLVIGKAVRGGLYGSMFPQSEVGGGTGNVHGYDNAGGEIRGLTALEHVYGTIAEHIQPGIGATVSPRMNAVAVESPGLLANLFR